jgi:Tfp pilus assembly protein PilV
MLLDVVVAITVLMVVLLPIAYLLSTTAKIQTGNQNRLTAQSLAASWLEQTRVSAEQLPTSPPSVNSATLTGSVLTWPTYIGTEKVGTITYYVYLAGGWCAYSGAGTQWGNGAVTTTTSGNATPLAYFIATKVAWGPDASIANPTSLGQNDGTVVEYSSVQSLPGWQVPVTGGGSQSVLTLASTSTITGNVCPLALTGATS